MSQESRSMTLGDVMMLSVGVAVGLAIVGRQEVVTSTGFLALVPDRYEVLAERLVGWTWVGAVAISSVAMGRVFRGARPPRPAEWLVLVATICYAVGSERIWFADWASYRTWMSMDEVGDFPRVQVLTCVAAGLIAAVGLATLRAARRALPAWATTLGLCGSIALLSWGPAFLLASVGASWVAPSGGFSGFGLKGFFTWSITSWFARTPAGLMLGLPVAGAIVDRARRRPATWVELASLTSSTSLFALLMAGWRPESDPDTWVWVAEWGMMIGWVVGVLGLSCLIHSRVGPIGRFWSVAPQPEDSTPSLASPSSTA